MLGYYNTSLKVTAQEMSNIGKEDGDMTLSNSGSTDDKAHKTDNKNERIRKGLMSTSKAIENVYSEVEEKLIREYEIYCQNSLMRKY